MTETSTTEIYYAIFRVCAYNNLGTIQDKAIRPSGKLIFFNYSANIYMYIFEIRMF